MFQTTNQVIFGFVQNGRGTSNPLGGHMRKIKTIVRFHGTMGLGGQPTSIRMAVDDYHFAKELPGNVDDSPILRSHLGV